MINYDLNKIKAIVFDLDDYYFLLKRWIPKLKRS